MSFLWNSDGQTAWLVGRMVRGRSTHSFLSTVSLHWSSSLFIPLIPPALAAEWRPPGVEWRIHWDGLGVTLCFGESGHWLIIIVSKWQSKWRGSIKRVLFAVFPLCRSWESFENFKELARLDTTTSSGSNSSWSNQKMQSWLVSVKNWKIICTTAWPEKEGKTDAC